jgi:hypothetical protein
MQYQSIKKCKNPFFGNCYCLNSVGRGKQFEDAGRNELSKGQKCFYNQSPTNLNNHLAKGTQEKRGLRLYYMMKTDWINYLF